MKPVQNRSCLMVKIEFYYFVGRTYFEIILILYLHSKKTTPSVNVFLIYHAQRGLFFQDQVKITFKIKYKFDIK